MTLSRGLARACGTAAVALGCLLPGARAEDLIQAFELARGHDAALLAATAQQRAATPRAAQARAALRPNVALSASSNWSRYDPPPTGSDPAGAAYSQRVDSATLNLRQPLFNRGARLDVDAAEVGIAIARADLDITEQDFILRVSQAYFDVLQARDVLETRRVSRLSFGEQLESAKKRFQAGLSIITDQQDAQARYDLAESDEIAAGNDLRVRQLALDRLTGRNGFTPQLLAPQPPGSAPMPPGELGEWITQAGEHPAVRRARLALERTRLDTRRARAAHEPTLDLVGSTSANRTRGGVGLVSTTVLGRTNTSTIGIELNVPLYAGNARQNRVDETVLLEEQARLNLEAAQRTASEATERAYFDYRSTLAQVRALEAAEASSRTSLEGTKLGYRAGVRLNLDVLNAQTLLFQTRSDLAKARYEVLMRGLRLAAASGTLRFETLQLVNRLLAPATAEAMPRP